MKSSSRSGFTRIEALVAIGVILVLALVVGTGITNSRSKANLMRTVSNARQIHQIALSAELDRKATGDTNIVGWPGTNFGFTAWVSKQAAQNTNISTNTWGKLFSAPGVDVIGLPKYEEGKTALRVYQVSSASPESTVFLSSFNWNAETAGAALSKHSVPFGDKQFVVLQMNGDGKMYRGSQATNAASTFGTLTNNVAP